MADQWTLGELTARFATIAEKAAYDTNRTVLFDFCKTFPTGFCSWRGSYEQLAVTWDFATYWGGHTERAPTVAEFRQQLANAPGSYPGWKGDDFWIGPDSPLWVDNPGECSRTIVCGLVEQKYDIIIVTARREEDGHG